MRLMLHTFRKDVRRLWPAVLVACVMLLMLARADRWRSDWMASPMEGWLTMLLTMAWACLAALAVQEEPLVGDRNFWTTRPHRWQALLAAKLVFVLLAVHLPSFLADLWVLAARGFSPAAYLPELLWKQFLFFAAVTLPAMAVASLVRSFTHFVIAGFVVATGILFLNGGFQAFREFGPLRDELHHALVRTVLALAAGGILWMQYAQRRILPGRVVAVAAGLAAASLATWLPARAEYQVEAASQTPRITMRNTAPPEELVQQFVDSLPTVMLPIAIDRGAQTDRFRMPMIEMVVTAQDGTRIQSVRSSPNHPYQKIDLSVYFPGVKADRLVLRFSRSAWERVKDARVHISGDAAFEFYRSSPAFGLPAQGASSFPDFGRCLSAAAEQNYNEGALKVECESPREAPAASVRVLNEWAGPGIEQRLSVFGNYLPGPHDTWLSPLHRSQAFFPITSFLTMGLGERGWRIPVESLPATRTVITPEISTGHALARFEFDDIPLKNWQVKQVLSPATRVH